MNHINPKMKNITFQKNEIIKRLYELDSVSNYRLHSIAQRIRKKTLSKLFKNLPVIDETIRTNIEMFNKIMGTKINSIVDFLNFNFKNFNNAEGRSNIHPLVRNNRYSQVAHDL